jgi:serine protease Do
MEALLSLSASVKDAAGRLGPSVTGVNRGSGVVVAPNRILTSAHNLRGDEPRVTLADGTTLRGRVLGRDVDGDLAVVEADTGDAPAVSIGSGEPVIIGTPVLALANPAGRGLRVTAGLVSAVDARFRSPRGRRVSGAIEHTAPMARGSSGGPLVDVAGTLIGLNTVRLPGGLILALPLDTEAAGRIDALSRGDFPEPRRLGVALAPTRVARRLQRAVGLPERDGLLVRYVEDGSAADQAGLKPGDLIVAAGERNVARIDDLFAALDAAGDDRLRLGVVRGADERELAVSFAGHGPVAEA